jgi:hypothetical protein
MSFISSIKQDVAVNVKNVIGWKTSRKIVVFSVDDYGNVQVDSKQAKDKMFANGLKTITRFDLYDALETPGDLSALYETLSAVKDKNNNPAVFTAFAICANIDFEKMRESNYEEYHYEPLPDTFKKLKGYEGTWELWQQGMKERLLVPQFHGREHLNLKVLMEGLRRKDKDILNCFENRSYTAIGNTGYKTIDFSAALDFYEFDENENLKSIVKDGLELFESVFGFKASNFTPCGSNGYSYVLDPVLYSGGIKYIDTSRFKAEHLGKGKMGKKIFNYTGKKNELGQTYLVRNCVFEPTEDRGIDWVAFCMKQIEAAFRWKMPANISSHRINFCGRIDPKNRETGLKALKKLLNAIVKRWPEAEFMSSDQLGNLINASA